MSSIDFHLQDFIFHQLILKNNFNAWKQKWHTAVRDLKPFWVYKKSEQILRSKGIYLDEYTERLERLKHKNVNLFGNINTDDKFVTLGYEKDERELKVEGNVPQEFLNDLSDETMSIGIIGRSRWIYVGNGISLGLLLLFV